MTTKLLAACLLLAGAAAGQQEIISQLPGGLKGEIVMLAKDNKAELSVAVKITNEAGSRGDAHILLFGRPSAFDDAGDQYDLRSITGVAYCPGPDTNPPSFRLCVGVPRIDEINFFPLQGYTDIEPGKSVMVHFAMHSGMRAYDKGERFSLAQEIAYRFADFDKDAALSQPEKMKALHFGTFSFTGVRPLTPDVQSNVKFNGVK